MEVVYRCCCGIDVHKSLIVACLRRGGKQELREFGTMTCEIKALASWLSEAGCEYGCHGKYRVLLEAPV